MRFIDRVTAAVTGKQTVVTHGMYLKCFRGRAQSSWLSDLQAPAAAANRTADKTARHIAIDGVAADRSRMKPPYGERFTTKRVENRTSVADIRSGTYRIWLVRADAGARVQ